MLYWRIDILRPVKQLFLQKMLHMKFWTVEVTSASARRSKSLQVASSEPEAMASPLGWNRTEFMSAVWPSKLWTGCPVRMSQINACLSHEPEVKMLSFSGLLNVKWAVVIYFEWWYTDIVALKSQFWSATPTRIYGQMDEKTNSLIIRVLDNTFSSDVQIIRSEQMFWWQSLSKSNP